MSLMPLGGILSAFNTALTEEQAWAMCYSISKFLKTGEHNSFSGLSDIFIRDDGTIKSVGPKYGIPATECELIDCLGETIFQTIDYGLADGEEHELSVCLEDLISAMSFQTNNKLSEEDEGFLNDNQISFDGIIKTCEDRLSTLTSSREATPPGQHYSAVCRAVVTEANELLSFIEKISSNQNEIEDKDLHREEWARIWMQTMKELRFGNVTLRKLTPNQLQRPRSFELTPFEVLMRDIAQRSYCLNKVETISHIPRKDAHDLILEFIRSRPPLLPVKDRVLAELEPPEPELREKILAEIRSIPKLKPTPKQEKKQEMSHAKKIIHADLKNFTLSFDDEFDYCQDIDEAEIERFFDYAAQPGYLDADVEAERHGFKLEAQCLVDYNPAFESHPRQATRGRQGEGSGARSSTRSMHGEQAKDGIYGHRSVGVRDGGGDAGTGCCVCKCGRNCTGNGCGEGAEFYEGCGGGGGGGECGACGGGGSGYDGSGASVEAANNSDHWLSTREDYARILRDCGDGRDAHFAVVRAAEKREGARDGQQGARESRRGSRDSQQVATESQVGSSREFSDGCLLTPADQALPTTSTTTPTTCTTTPKQDESLNRDQDMERSVVLPSRPMSPLTPLSPQEFIEDSQLDQFSFSNIEGCSFASVFGGRRGDLQSPTNTADLVKTNVKKSSSSSDDLKSKSAIATLKLIRPSLTNESMKLTLMELKHIRHVLTKVELEQLLFDINLFNEVSGGKICFTCRKVEFSVFKWKYNCEICSRYVCHKCIRKVHIPPGDLNNIPISVLTPSTIQCDFFMFHDDHHNKAEKTSSSFAPQYAKRLVCIDCKSLIRSIMWDHQHCSAGAGGGGVGAGKGGHAATSLKNKLPLVPRTSEAVEHEQEEEDDQHQHQQKKKNYSTKNNKEVAQKTSRTSTSNISRSSSSSIEAGKMKKAKRDFRLDLKPQTLGLVAPCGLAMDASLGLCCG